MDLEARARWVDYAEAKDEMFAYTDTREAPWYVVEADDKRTTRLNLISHLLSLIPYEDVPHEKIKLPAAPGAGLRPPAAARPELRARALRGRFAEVALRQTASRCSAFEPTTESTTCAARSRTASVVSHDGSRAVPDGG